MSSLTPLRIHTCAQSVNITAKQQQLQAAEQYPVTCCLAPIMALNYRCTVSHLVKSSESKLTFILS